MDAESYPISMSPLNPCDGSILTALGFISDIDNDISRIHQTLLSLPRSHPQCPAFAQTLAAAHYRRYKLSGQKRQDLD